MSMLDSLGGAQTGRATLGRTPIYRLMLAGEPIEVNVQDAVINLGENMHDSVVMTVSWPERTTTDGILDQPISFLYGSATRTEVFSGYVTELTEVQNDSGVLTFTMGIVGPTKTMQVGTPRFWVRRSISSAVEMLAYTSYLGFTGHDSPYPWAAIAQTNESNWQMIVSLARRLGWAVYNRYGIVMLYDSLQLLVNNGSAATLISETYTLAKHSPDEERTLLQFDPVEESENIPEQQGFKVAYFGGDGKVQVATQQGEHTTYRFLNDFVIRDSEEASLYVNSHDSDSSSWKQTATARILGNAYLFPGMSVEIMTSNPKYYTGKFNGRWLVRGIQHKMDKQSFQSNLVLARPESKMQVYDGAYTSFWDPTTRSRPTLSLNSATAAGVWVSSWTNPTVASVA